MANCFEYNDKMYFHPGYYLHEIMMNEKITFEEISKKMKTSPLYVKELVDGVRDLTGYDAFHLSLITNTSTKMWISLQNEYNKGVALRDENDIFLEKE